MGGIPVRSDGGEGERDTLDRERPRVPRAGRPSSIDHQGGQRTAIYLTRLHRLDEGSRPQSLQHIAYRTPEQNGTIESFHKTLKREYVWPFDFQSYQEAERAIAAAFLDYNLSRIHSALGYLTPYEFLELWFADEQDERQEEKVISVG